jgi:crotonobetainyl-CoA:carnitine CoA-transferase CaiB-like acyl-CoA transferase
MATTRPFDGLKVLDFMWAAVGPLTSRYLAEHGATVVKIESVHHPDSVRVTPPYLGRQPGINRAHLVAEVNVNKLSLGINMAKPGGAELAKRIITTWEPDLVCENFTPRAMKNWGLDYPSVQHLKPDIIYYSSCQMGHSGPRSAFAGYGHLASAIAGYFHLTGWPDRGPVLAYGALSDFLSPPIGVAAITAALIHRKYTGEGQHIDQSQMEVPLHYLSPMLLDYQVNGRVLGRMGNRDMRYAPHGVFPCQGDDRWLAISVTSDEEWRALSRAMGDPAWAQDPRFGTALGRKQHEEELEKAIARWTRDKVAEDLMAKLQEAGVGAGVAISCTDMHNHPQLKHRNFFHYLEHPEGGTMPHLGLRFVLSKTPGTIDRCYGRVGADTEHVLKDLVGLGDDEVGEMAAEGVLEWS